MPQSMTITKVTRTPTRSSRLWRSPLPQTGQQPLFAAGDPPAPPAVAPEPAPRPPGGAAERFTRPSATVTAPGAQGVPSPQDPLLTFPFRGLPFTNSVTRLMLRRPPLRTRKAASADRHALWPMVMLPRLSRWPVRSALRPSGRNEEGWAGKCQLSGGGLAGIGAAGSQSGEE